MDRFKQLLITVLSVGWIAPMWVAAWLFVDFWQTEGFPLLLGQQSGNSFEWFGPIKDSLNLGFAWLAAAVAYWSWVGSSAFGRRRAA